MINPKKNRVESTQNISAAEKVMRWTATVTTSLGAYIWARSLAFQYLPEGWAWNELAASAAALCAAALMAWLTDLMFGNLLQRVAYDVMAARHPNVVKWQGPAYFASLRRAESIGFGVLLVSLLAFDMYTTLVIREPIADEARQIEVQDIATITASIGNVHTAATEPMLQRINALKKEIASEESRVAANNPLLKKLISEGNAWAINDLARKKNAATRTKRAELNKLDTTYNNALGNAVARIAETEFATNKRNLEIIQRNQNNRAVMAGMYTAFTVLPKVLAVILRILMVISFLAYSQNYNPDLTGDGIIDYKDVDAHSRQNFQ